METQILWVAPTLALLGGYLLGSIPFGVLLTRAAGAGDPGDEVPRAASLWPVIYGGWPH